MVKRGNHYKDLKGKRFDRLLVINDIGRRNGNVLWECKCDCNKMTSVSSAELLRKKDGTKSCGCLQREIASNKRSINLTGKKFNKLFVLNKTNQKTNSGSIKWNCKCECGNKKSATTKDLISGHTKSCGCLQKKWAKEHIYQLAEKQKGANHPCWRGGLNLSYPTGIWTTRYRTEIRKRDGYKCQTCGKVGIGLDIHHIDKDKKNCNTDNLLTLCRKCHRNIHCNNISLVLSNGVKEDFVDGGYSVL